MTTTYADIACLLVPVSAANPVGVNLEYEKIFDDIRLARESDPDYLPNDEWSYSEPRRADWNKVFDLCSKALTTQTKDFQIACWLVEAFVHTRGLDGLEEGLYFLDDFIRRYWYHCWPELDDEGEIIRFGKLSSLEKNISEAVCGLNLFEVSTVSVTAWRNAVEFDSLLNRRPEEREELLEVEGKETVEDFMRQTVVLSSVRISELADKIDVVLVNLTRLEEGCQSVSPQGFHPFTRLRAVINEVQHLLQKISMNVLPETDSMVELNFESQENIAAETHPFSPAMQHGVNSRSQAINQMREIARYFRDNEPSSPVPYLLDRAIKWTGMPITAWLEEMLSDESSRREIENVLTGRGM